MLTLPNPRPRYLIAYLRCLAILDALAFLVPFLPRESLSLMHGQLGLDTFPADSMTGYLARSASLFYGMHGVLLWYLSRNVVHYRALLQFLGILAIIHGAILLWICRLENLTSWWAWSQGPLYSASGILLFSLTLWALPIPACAEGQRQPS